MTQIVKVHDPNAITFHGDKLIAEASDLRLPVGEFPEALSVPGPAKATWPYTAQAVTFWRTQRRVLDAGGEDTIAVIYDSGDPNLPQLHVLND